MQLNFLQTFLMVGLIIGVVGVFFAMLLLTWALISHKAPITTASAGKWIMIFFVLVVLCYTFLITSV